MHQTFAYHEIPAEDLLDNIAIECFGALTDPDTAAPGDIIGFILDTKSSSGRESYCTNYPIEQFIVLDENAQPLIQDWGNMNPQRQTDFALLAMKLNRLHIGSSQPASNALDLLDDQEGDLYARIIVLPTLALVCRDMYVDLMDIDQQDAEDTQQQIDLHFAVLRQSETSNHAALTRVRAEERDLGYLTVLAPILEDFNDSDSPQIAMAFAREE